MAVELVLKTVLEVRSLEVAMDCPVVMLPWVVVSTVLELVCDVEFCGR